MSGPIVNVDWIERLQSVINRMRSGGEWTWLEVHDIAGEIQRGQCSPNRRRAVKKIMEASQLDDGNETMVFALLTEAITCLKEGSIQSQGGHARKKVLSKEERSRIASEAAYSRWHGTGERKIAIPLSRGAAVLPREMTAQDFEVLIGTLNLWKAHLVLPEEKK